VNNRTGGKNDNHPISGDVSANWEDHIRHEFETRSTETRSPRWSRTPTSIMFRLLTAAVAKRVARVYATHFIPRMPPDMEMSRFSRTIGSDQLVDEMVIKFTHSVELDWMLRESHDWQAGGGRAGRGRPIPGRQTGT